ncbi:hypothetical protein BDR03DRAFT_966773 [Suillus americanus]|nr:hypothetical protein BDR03DRAFT_966773 [Suillus americanus]
MQLLTTPLYMLLLQMVTIPRAFPTFTVRKLQALHVEDLSDAVKVTSSRETAWQHNTSTTRMPPRSSKWSLPTETCHPRSSS